MFEFAELNVSWTKSSLCFSERFHYCQDMLNSFQGGFINQSKFFSQWHLWELKTFASKDFNTPERVIMTQLHFSLCECEETFQTLWEEEEVWKENCRTRKIYWFAKKTFTINLALEVRESKLVYLIFWIGKIEVSGRQWMVLICKS